MKLSSTVFTRYLSAVALACAAALPVMLHAQEAQTPALEAMCVNRTNGQVRFVTATDVCRTNETRAALDTFMGPQGPQGATGAQGAPGAAGAKGGDRRDGCNRCRGCNRRSGSGWCNWRNRCNGCSGCYRCDWPRGTSG